MAIPPPPPPPIGNLKLAPSGNNKSNAGGADARSALLQSIQKGAKLKKTTTVDKSGPILAGKVANSAATAAAPSTRSISNNGPTAAGSNNSIQTNNGMPKLGGIFEGLSSMPKLKPVGGRTPTSRTSPPSDSPVHSASQNTPVTNNAASSNGVSDFNAELTKHLTLKKQQKQQQPPAAKVSETASRLNRGPPPQPPQPPNKNVSTDASQISSNSFLNKQNQHQFSDSEKNISIQPNKSSLFGKNAAPAVETSSSNNIGTSSSNNHNHNSTNSNTRINTNNSTNNSNSINSISNHTTTNKSVPNHGKPNCAPKPPGIQQIMAAKNNSNANGSIASGTTNNSSRPVVSRHHSMRSPRSPPISVAAGPVFPTTQHFGTMRGAPPSFQSQDAINTSIRQQPSAPISRPTVAPPRPPNMKPPPPPIRSISNTNLTTLPLSMPASVANANNFGSASNVSTLKEQFSSIKAQSGVTSSANNVSALVSSTSALNSSNNSNSTNHTNNNSNLSPASSRERNVNGTVAPPLPPHRTCPAPPPPIRQTSMTPSANATNNGGAPPVPQRGSSMRNSNPNVQQMTTVSAKSSSASSSSITSVSSSTRTTTITRIVVDLDAKFGNAFHNVTEFPAPSPFTNFQKSYPSRNAKTPTGS